MASEDKDSKTEAPTPKRLSEARKEGQIARSADLVSWGSILIGALALQSTVGKCGQLMQTQVYQMGHLIEHPDIHTALKFMTDSISKAFMAILPLMGAFMVIGIIGHFAQVRFVIASKAIKPSFKKMNPITGFKRMFSKHSLFESAKQLVKAAAIGFVSYKMLWGLMSTFSSGGPYAIGQLIGITGSAALGFVRNVAIIGVVMGLIDYFYQRRKVGSSLKMTKQQVKEETKQQDINPEIKGKMKQKQFQMSRNRMMAAVQDADVVVVNPVHIAVALKYNPESGAPVVVATGAGFVAEKIRDRASEEGIPMVQDIPLARTLHKVCDVGDEIPGALFEAVARVLAFVFSLKANGRHKGFHKMPGTPELHEVDVDPTYSTEAAAS